MANDSTYTGLYASKADHYFGSRRQDWIDALRQIPAKQVLEIGCGAGATGGALLKAGISDFVAGVELTSAAAALARQQLSEVVEGNLETIDLPWDDDRFDAVLVSEVLEHLIDPPAAVRKLYRCIRPGGWIFASSPNVSHHRVIRSLIWGRWDLTDSGIMDRTHLRWFTPSTYRRLFEDCGFRVTHVGPVGAESWKIKAANTLTLGGFRHLFMRQVQIRATKS